MLTRTRRLTIAATLTAGMALAGAGTAVAAPPANAGKPLSTALEPGQNVNTGPGATFVGAEGASGSASLRLNRGQGTICVDLTTDGLDLVLAHIHEGARGTNGGVVVDLTSLIDGDSAVGCVDVDRALVKEISQDPADYYINTHEGAPLTNPPAPTDPFFSGIRGQLG